MICENDSWYRISQFADESLIVRIFFQPSSLILSHISDQICQAKLQWIEIMQQRLIRKTSHNDIRDEQFEWKAIDSTRRHSPFKWIV